MNNLLTSNDSPRSYAATLTLLLVGVFFTVVMVTPVHPSDAECPRRCSCPKATEVLCKSTGLRDLPSGLDRDVDTLNFGHNAISQLSARVLASVQQLTKLNLENNRVLRIKDDAFQNMVNLKELILSGNQLRHITVGSFRGLQKLELLELKGNRLESIEEAFTDLPALKKLVLSTNRISAITQFTFKELKNIRFLILAENSIHHIDRRAFRFLTNLMYFVLKGNPLGNIDNIEFNSQLLSYMDLSECSLRYVPKGLPSSLRYLQLRRNNMTLIHREAFVSTPYLSILVLDGNGITYVERDAFNKLQYLQQLWLNDNLLNVIPQKLPRSLQRLLMDNNRLVQVINSFQEGAQLDTLSLMGNNITFIAPNTFNHTNHLKNVDLSNNHIRSIYPETFANLTALDTLQLSKNPLKYFYEGCFEGLYNLQTLHLGYISTNATMHPHAFNDMTGIKHLDLDSSPGVARAILKSPTLLNNLYTVEVLNMQGMDFKSLPREFSDVFYNLDTLRLTSTRWHCDQGITWFRDWLQTATLVIETRDNLLCFTPHSLHNRPIIDLEDAELIPVITTPHPLLRPITTLYFPPIPTIITDIATPPPSTVHTNLKSKGNNRRKKTTTTSRTTITSTTIYTTTATAPYKVENPEFEQFLDKAFGKDRAPVPNIVLNRTDRVPPETRNRKDHVEIEMISRDDPFQIGRTTTIPEGERSTDSSSISATLLVIVAGGVLSTVIVIAIATTIIVLGSRRCKKQQKTPARNGNMNGIPADKKTIQYQHKDNTLYFMPAEREATPQTILPTNNTGSMRSIKSTRSTKHNKTNGTSKERMALVSGRDVNHEGPLKVYKWDEF